MRRAFATFASLSSLLLVCGCSTSYSQRDEAARTISNDVASQSQRETEWLRAEVVSLRRMLAERDRRDADMLRAYIALAQRTDELLEHLKAATQAPLEDPNRAAKCAPAAASGVQSPPKSVVYAINRSHLSDQQKRALLQSMKPPRTIDNTNPWMYGGDSWPPDVTNEAPSR